MANDELLKEFLAEGADIVDRINGALDELSENFDSPEIVDRMFADLGAAIFGRRTYDITHGWGGTFPVNDSPLFILTHTPPPFVRRCRKANRRSCSLPRH